MLLFYTASDGWGQKHTSEVNSMPFFRMRCATHPRNSQKPPQDLTSTEVRIYLQFSPKICSTLHRMLPTYKITMLEEYICVEDNAFKA